MHAGAQGKFRVERVEQVRSKESSVYKYENYVPIGNAVDKLTKWEDQGADIVYLSSHESKTDIEKDKLVLKKYNFPDGSIYYRKKGETYADVAEKVMPDILIEDDCESIGGKKDMTYTYIKPDVKKKIKLFEVKEFEGIDHLPDSLKLI